MDSIYVPSPSMKLRELIPENASLISQVIRKILSLNVAKETLAQIVDNMPINRDYVGRKTEYMIKHPDIENRTQPSAKAMEAAEKISAEIDPMDFEIDKHAGEKFQEEMKKEYGSIVSILRFLEIASALVHDIMSKIYVNFHNETPEEFRRGYKDPNCRLDSHSYHCCPLYGRLYHHAYVYERGLKNSLASIVAYWAETIIFGGPVIFTKGEAGTECSAAHVHLPHRRGIAKLSENQLRSFFSLVDEGYNRGHDGDTVVEHSSPLPFTFSEDVSCFPVNVAVQDYIYRENGQMDARERGRGLPRNAFIRALNPKW